MAKSRRHSAAFSTPQEAWRRDNVGRAIVDATRTFEQDVLEVVGREGYPQIRMVHLNLLRHLDLQGTRLTELAERANITKQSMQELVDRVQAFGYVERRPDPHDKRAKVVAFSKDGLRLLETLHKAVTYMERQMIEILGRSAVRQIERSLHKYNRLKSVPRRKPGGRPARRLRSP
jgi:DNA-binding MarR family transcriptional regulator